MGDQSDDLDQLLDSALDDFQNLNLASSGQKMPQTAASQSRDYREVDGGSSNTEGNKQDSSNLKSGRVLGLGMGLPDLKVKKMGKQKVPQQNQELHISEALDKLREQTREAVKGLESVTGQNQPPVEDNFGDDAMVDELLKQFEGLTGSQDMESIVETMMQQLLSKEILHDPMKEIGERYPAWLEENKSRITNEEYARYSHQYELIKDLNQVYETEPGNYNKIFELMQKMQECGQPPKEIVQELAPEFDLSNLGQLGPDMLESPQNCRVM